jgi:hypothetical protein
MTQLKKADLIKILVEEYGYEKEDLKFDSQGKPYTNAKLQMLINAEKEDAEELEMNAHRVVEKDGTGLKDDDKVRVMSGSMGTVIYRSDTSRRVWKFTSFGQIETIPYGELVTIRNRFPRYYQEGWFIVLDKKVQDEFGLTQMYQNILTPENIDKVFQTTDIHKLDEFITYLPEGMKNAFINKAMELYNSNQLYDMRIINLIQDKFKFSLEDNAPLEDIAVKGNANERNIIIVDKV